MDILNFTNYGARLVEYAVQSDHIANTYYLGKNASTPLLLESERSMRSLSVNLEFRGKDRQETTQRISNFTAAVAGKCEIKLPDAYYYTCIFQSASEPTVTLPTMMDVAFTFSAIRHGAEVTTTLTQASQGVNVQGNTEAECVLTITPAADLDSVTVMGITVYNLAANIPVIIDGRNKLVTEGGGNKFADTNLISFPRLKPGPCTIAISDPSNVTVQLSYFPIYI